MLIKKVYVMDPKNISDPNPINKADRQNSSDFNQQNDQQASSIFGRTYVWVKNILALPIEYLYVNEEQTENPSTKQAKPRKNVDNDSFQTSANRVENVAKEINVSSLEDEIILESPDPVAMMIHSLIKDVTGYTNAYREQILENAPDLLKKKYLESTAATITSQESNDSLASDFSNEANESNEIMKLDTTDLLIQAAEDLEILLEINETTKAIDSNLMRRKANEVALFLKKQMLESDSYGLEIPPNLKKSERVYSRLLLKLAKFETSLFCREIDFLMSDSTVNNKKEIALALAQSNRGAAALVENIKKFSSEDKTCLKDIAFAIAENEAGAEILAENIDKFSIHNEEDRSKIALAIARHGQGAARLAENIDKFSIHNEEDRSKIALAIARHGQGAARLAENIKKISIEDEACRYTIALAIAKQKKGAAALAANIKDFSIEDKTHRKDIALAIADNYFDALAFIGTIKEFSIEDDADLKQIALKLIRMSNYRAEKLDKIIGIIQEFSFEDETYLKQITAAITRNRGGAEYLADKFDKLPIEKEENRKEIALEIALYAKAASILLRNIEKDPIKDEAALKEVLLAVAEHRDCADYLAQNIDKFFLQNEDYRTEIALTIAKHFRVVDKLIKNLRLFSIAKIDNQKKIALALTDYSFGAETLGNNIDKFSLNKDDWYQIALVMAEHKTTLKALVENIGQFSLKGEELLAVALEVAKTEKGAKVLAENIGQFSLSGDDLKKIAFEIAKHERGAKVLAENIGQFSLSGDDLKKIAFEIAKHEWGAKQLAKTIDQFSLSGDDLKKIAFEIAKHEWGAEELATNIGAFSIEDEADRHNLAIEIMKQGSGPKILAANVERFSFEEESRRKDLAIAIAASPSGAEVLAHNIRAFAIHDEKTRYKIALALAHHQEAAPILADKLKVFSLTQAHQNEVALALAESPKGAAVLAKNMGAFAFNDEVTRYKMALTLAHHREAAPTLADKVEEISLSDAHRKDLALEIARWPQGAGRLVININGFNIHDEESRYRIALAIAESSWGAEDLAQNINQFSLSDAHKNKIALAIAKHKKGAKYLIRNFESFFSKDEKDRKDILVAIAHHEKRAVELVHKIEEFSLEEEGHRKEIALVIARHGQGAVHLAPKINKFSIKNQADLNEIAHVMTEHELGTSYLISYFDKFSILKKSNRKAIALEIAESGNNLGMLIANIDKFRLEKESDRKEIALAVLEHKEGAIKLMEKYGYKKLRIDDTDFEREVVRLASRWPDLLPLVKEYLKNSEILEDDSSFDAIRQFPTRPAFKEIQDVNEKRQLLFRPFDLAEVKLEEVKKRIEEKMAPLSENFPDDPNLEIIKNYYSLEPKGRPSLKDHQAACKAFRKKIRKHKDVKRLNPLILNLEQEGTFWAPIYDCVEAILEIDGDLQYELTHWMNYSLFRLLETREKSKIGPPFESQLLKKIYNVRDGALRFHLVTLFAEQMSRTDWKETISPSYAFMTKILLNDLKKSHPEINTDCLTQTLGKRAGIFKDGEKAKILYNALWGLKKSVRVNTDTINAIFDHLSRSEKKSLPEGGETKSLVLDDTTFLLELKALNALVGLKKESSITFDSSDINKEQLIKNLSQVFDEPMPGLVISDSTRFSEYFFGDRQPGALAIYVAGLLKLSPSDSEALLRTVKTFIEEVDADTFQSSRYQKSETLDRIAETSPQVLEKWKKEKSGALADYLQADVGQDIARQIIESIETKIVADSHLPLNKLPKVAEFYAIKIDPSESFDDLDTLLLNLIQKPDLLTVDYLEEILEALRELPENEVGEFINDVMSFKEGLKPTVPKRIETWTIVDSDDPLDLFLAGTEVGGSCQRVDGNPKLNKALMGYVMDGKHRILAVKDSRGQILERFILRLLIDKETNKPVLFFERIYPATAKYRSALLNFAKERAKELGVPLVSKETVAKGKYKGSLVSYPSKAPYEYSDAARGIQTRGFELSGCYQHAP